MFSHLCLTILLATIVDAAPPDPHRRQSNPAYQREDLPYGGWYGGGNNPSGAIPGAYYGSGVNPNYGDSQSNQNGVPNGGINAISYNQGSNLNNYYPNSNQQQQYYPNNNNAWQRPGMNNQPNNRYPPGSQGWYATGGNHWYNRGPSLLAHGWLLITAIVLLAICM